MARGIQYGQGHSESSTRLESFKSRIEWMSGIKVNLNNFPSQSRLIKITQLQLPYEDNRLKERKLSKKDLCTNSRTSALTLKILNFPEQKQTLLCLFVLCDLHCQ